VTEGVSADLEGVSPSVTVNNIPPSWEDVPPSPPGIVYFNYPTVIWDPATYVPPEPGPESEILTPDPIGSITTYEPVAINEDALANFQFISPIGTVFGYHPLTSTDMDAIEQLRLGAGSYSLSGGVLSLIGNEGLLQFFQEFDQKRKSGSL